MRHPKGAKRYAKSVLDLAIERKEEELVFNDLALVERAIEESRDLRQLVNSPVVNIDRKERILAEIFNDKVGEVTQHLLKVLTSKNREMLIHEISEQYQLLYLAHKGITKATVRSATALSDADRKEVIALAKKISGLEVQLTESVDADMIGGFVLQVAGKEFNGSVAHQLRQIRRSFDSNHYVADY
jgi:F-type H+-transporting ATPase subunit delta